MTLELDLPAVKAEVESAFRAYEQALIGNDVEVLDRLFWQDPRVVRYGAGENLYGYEQIAEFRRQRSPKGLFRELRNTCITVYGQDLATAWTEFTRPGSERIGRQSQVWMRLEEGWRIVAAHVSYMEAV